MTQTIISPRSATGTALVKRHHEVAAGMGLRVQFSRDELDWLRSFSSRVRLNKTTRDGDSTWDQRGFEERNYIGARGAYAVARLLDVPFDDTLYSGQDSGWDLSYGVHHLEVKTLQAWLTFTNAQVFRCQHAILVNTIRGSEDVLAVGGISRRKFIESCFVADFGYGERLCVTAEALSPLKVGG